MKINTDEFKDLLGRLADDLVRDGLATGEAFWNRMKDDTGRINQAKDALKRYANHNLNAWREPERADEHHQSAAHDLNTLANLGAATVIETRREARAYLERVIQALIAAAEKSIDIFL